MLRKYISDPSHVLENPPIELREDLSFEVQPIGILDHREKVLRNKVVLMVKILWRSDGVKEMKWEMETSMRKHFLYCKISLRGRIAELVSKSRGYIRHFILFYMLIMHITHIT